MTDTAMRICSLLPSATEIVYALGLGDRLVAVTHECDYPPEAQDKPHITRSLIDSDGMSAAEIDQAVRDNLADQSSIYQLDGDLLASLQPDLMLTQELCDVCAVGPPVVQAAVAVLAKPPKVVSLEPHTIGQVLQSILQVGRLAGVEERAEMAVGALQSRIDAVSKAIADSSVIRVLTLEWVDPVFVGGHWVPEQVEMAGGQDVLGQAGQPSRQVRWEEVMPADPDVVIAMPCGFDLARSEREMARARLPAAWDELRAVKAGDVFVVDGSAYFNRPGPRLVDGVEILATILHPEVYAKAPPASFGRFRR